MAHTDAVGNLQLDQEDIIPKEIAVKTDDPPAIVALIEAFNKKGYVSNEAFEKALAQVDRERTEYHNKPNPDLVE